MKLGYTPHIWRSEAIFQNYLVCRSTSVLEFNNASRTAIFYLHQLGISSLVVLDSGYLTSASSGST